jgi:DNA invertase Pin-like site-specific DNA recombinase
MTKKDIVRDIIERFLAAAPETFSEDMAGEIERQIRHDWGGTEVKIAKRAAELRRERAVTALQNGVPLKDVQATTGISRTALYRLLAKPARRQD